MSRPQKIHKPIKGAFDDILSAIGLGTGKGKRAANKLATGKVETKPRQRKRRK